jgi:hypothetical protein
LTLCSNGNELGNIPDTKVQWQDRADTIRETTARYKNTAGSASRQKMHA